MYNYWFEMALKTHKIDYWTFELYNRKKKYIMVAIREDELDELKDGGFNIVRTRVYNGIMYCLEVNNAYVT